MVKIILDARKIEDYGIGVYVENLFQGIINSNQHLCRILHLRGTRYLMAPESTFIEVLSKNYDLREHLEIPLKIRKMKDFYYFSPHYVFPFYIKNQLLVTVHDLIHFKFAHFFRPQLRVKIGRFFMQQVKERAKMVFAVSQKTRDDLVEVFGFEEDRIKVIYNGLSDLFFRESRKASLFPFPYVIYVGNLKPHKNLTTLLRAFSMIKDTFRDLRLFLAGSTPDKAFMLALKELGLEQRVLFRPYLQQTELIHLLDGAEFFIFPSFYEGFGFPPLEAMARKKAVISSPGGSLREILGESVLYFRPDSYEELAEKMSMLIENEELRKAFEEKGHTHSLSFRWDKTIKQYLSCLQKLS